MSSLWKNVTNKETLRTLFALESWNALFASCLELAVQEEETEA